MFRKILMASLIMSASAFGALAATGPQVMDEAQSRSITYDMPSANIVGSANATITGGDTDRDYMTQRVLRTQRADGMYRFGTRQNWTIGVDSNS